MKFTHKCNICKRIFLLRFQKGLHFCHTEDCETKSRLVPCVKNCKTIETNSEINMQKKPITAMIDVEIAEYELFKTELPETSFYVLWLRKMLDKQKSQRIKIEQIRLDKKMKKIRKAKRAKRIVE